MTDTPPPKPLDDDDDKPALEDIQRYVWARYVKFRRPPFEVDEVAALAAYADHYRERGGMTGDSECFYYGILAYEQAFASPEPDRELLKLAVQAFEAYAATTDQHFTWDAVEDRYHEAREALASAAD